MSPTLTEPQTQTASRSRARGEKSDRAEVNRRNAQKSTGPRSAEGKARSRLNALKHGMTAESMLLPGEDGSEFKSRLQELLDDLKPRNRLEELLIERIARDDWMSIRAERAAAARVALRLRHDTVEQSREEIDEAIELGHRLLYEIACPLPIRLHAAKGVMGQAPMINLPGDPHHPARLVLRLEGTIAGCDWLLGRWAGLRERLEIEGLWQMSEGFTMVRLMGQYAVEVRESYEVQFVLLASLCVAEKNTPEPKNSEPKEPWPDGPDTSLAEIEEWLQKTAMGGKGSIPEMIAETRRKVLEWCEPFTQALNEQPSMSRLNPADVHEATKRLSAVMKQEVRRIEEIRTEHERIAALDAAEAPARLAFETGPEGDKQRRYVLSRDRLLNRTIDTFLKARNTSEAGALDPVDIDWDNPLDPDDADGPTGSEPVVDVVPGGHGDAVDPCDRQVEAGAIVPEDDHEGDRQVDSSPDLDGRSPAQNPAEDATCDAECILRNEANSPDSPPGPGQTASDSGPVLPAGPRAIFVERPDDQPTRPDIRDRPDTRGAPPGPISLN